MSERDMHWKLALQLSPYVWAAGTGIVWGVAALLAA